MTEALPALSRFMFAGGGWCIWRKGIGPGVPQAPVWLSPRLLGTGN